MNEFLLLKALCDMVLDIAMWQVRFIKILTDDPSLEVRLKNSLDRGRIETMKKADILKERMLVTFPPPQKVRPSNN